MDPWRIYQVKSWGDAINVLDQLVSVSLAGCAHESPALNRSIPTLAWLVLLPSLDRVAFKWLWVNRHQPTNGGFSK